MVFSSLVFLCIFLPIVWILHFYIPSNRGKNILLLFASLLFYTFGEPVYVLLMLFSGFFNYICALLIDRKKRKALLAFTVAGNLLVLCFFKYTGFLVQNLNAVFHLDIPIPAIIMPIGISFFTFQALSYVIDVYRNEVALQRNFGKLLLYISFFPQLIAGPIVRYADIETEIGNREVSWELSSRGMRRFLIGLGKKVLIANTMAETADLIFGSISTGLNAPAAWLGAVTYMLQIYYDFSGYSDMAIGLGWMFGFHFQENFRYPYMASSMQDFWRRWHISLSSWFRDYVYIPLGGNRKGRERTIINRLIVFLLTGLWHGANWTFVIWGLFHGFFLLLEELVPVIRKLPLFIRKVYTLLTVMIGFVIFRADSIGEAIVFLKNMFTGFWSSPFMNSFILQRMTPYFLFMLLAAVIGCGPVSKAFITLSSWETSENLSKKQETLLTCGYIASILILFWCVLRLSASSYNPFIYFRF